MKPLAAARLCNFRTGEYAPRDTHIEWINNALKNAVGGSPNPWLDIYAYASRKGTNTGYDNQALSERRRGAIHDAIVTAIPRAGLIKQDKAFGASLSGGDANNNDGYWRAVEVYAYGELPKKREPDPVPPPPPPKPKPNPTPMPRPDWWVNSFSVSGLSLVIEVGGGFADGTIGFENLTSGETITERITIGGVSVGESVGIDKLKKVADILSKSAIAKKAIEWVLNSLSGGRQSWPSWAVGPVWPMPGHSNLTGNGFLGTCFSVFVNAAAGPGNGGFYLMFMGTLACSKPPKGYARWSLRLLERKVVELNIVERASDNTIGRVLKKYSQAPPAATMGHSAQGQQRGCRRHGRRAGRLYATARS